jgi:uncharacterized protein YbaP (TraB family)
MLVAVACATFFFGTLHLKSAQSEGTHPEITNGTLWRIQRSDCMFTSYLFGTIHSTDAVVFRLGDSVLTALEQVDVFANEWALSDPANAPRIVELGRALDSMTSTQPITSEWGKRQVFADSVVGSYEAPLDNYLLRYAVAHRKRTTGLSSIDTVISVARRVTNRHVNAAEKSTTSSDSITIVPNIVDLYAKGNLDSLTIAIRTEASGAMIEELFERRDHLMSDSLSRLAREHSVFAAVGIGHLKRMVELLRIQGWTIEPVIQRSFRQAPPRIDLPPGTGVTTKVFDTDSLFSFVAPGNVSSSGELGDQAMKARTLVLMDPTRNVEWMIIVMPKLFKSIMQQTFTRKLSKQPSELVTDTVRIGNFTLETISSRSRQFCYSTVDIKDKSLLVFTASDECFEQTRLLVESIHIHRP